MIRIEALWLATTPIDMRMGAERLLAKCAHPPKIGHFVKTL